MDKFELLRGQVSDLKFSFAAQKHKFNFEFVIEGRRVIGCADSAHLPLFDGNLVVAFCEQGREVWRVLGLANLTLGGQIWQQRSGSLVLSTVLFALFLGLGWMALIWQFWRLRGFCYCLFCRFYALERLGRWRFELDISLGEIEGSRLLCRRRLGLNLTINQAVKSLGLYQIYAAF